MTTAVGGLGLGACSSDVAEEPVTTVFAASSLSAVLDDVGGHAFTASVAGSQTLRAQIESGARPDIFVSASRAHADSVAGIGGYAPSVPLFCAPLVAVTRRSDAQADADDRNVDWLTSFEDFSQITTFAVAADAVPAGMWAERMLERYDATTDGAKLSSHVLEHAISRDLSVLQVAQRVLRGEAQVGFVYEPVARQFAEQLRIVRAPAQASVNASYWATARDDASVADWLVALRTSAMADGRGFSSCAAGESVIVAESPTDHSDEDGGVQR